MMRRFLHPVWLGILLLSGCSFPWNQAKTTIVEATPPALSVDNSFFESKGCFDSPDCLPESFQLIDFPIEVLEPVNESLGGLSPAVPMAMAVNNSPYFLGDDNFTYSQHCLVSRYTRYIVYADEGYQLLDTRSKLAAFYTPVDSPLEAYSFAIAATGYRPLYNIAEDETIFYEAKVIEDSHVDESNDGYVVHLFDNFMCGCGPHYTKAIDVTVHTDGTLEISEPLNVFRNPALDDVCAD